MRDNETAIYEYNHVVLYNYLMITVCMSSLTSHLPFLSQYVNLSGGWIAVLVTDLFTGWFLLTRDVLLEIFIEECPLDTTLRCSLILLISPCGVSTMYDWGVLECAVTLPGEGVDPDVTQTCVIENRRQRMSTMATIVIYLLSLLELFIRILKFIKVRL